MYTDPTGLIVSPTLSAFQMNRGPWADNFIPNSGKYVRNEGCAVAFLANAISTANGTSFDPNKLLSRSSVFDDKGKLIWDKAASLGGMKADRREDQLTRSKFDTLKKSDIDYKVGVQVRYDDDKDDLHWVGVNDMRTDSDGNDYFVISKTSTNDLPFDSDTGTSKRKSLGWKTDDDGNTLVPASLANGYVTLSRQLAEEKVSLPELKSSTSSSSGTGGGTNWLSSAWNTVKSWFSGSPKPSSSDGDN